jgi:hypothetical protein
MDLSESSTSPQQASRMSPWTFAIIASFIEYPRRDTPPLKTEARPRPILDPQKYKLGGPYVNFQRARGEAHR